MEYYFQESVGMFVFRNVIQRWEKHVIMYRHLIDTTILIVTQNKIKGYWKFRSVTPLVGISFHDSFFFVKYRQLAAADT